MITQNEVSKLCWTFFIMIQNLNWIAFVFPFENVNVTNDVGKFFVYLFAIIFKNVINTDDLINEPMREYMYRSLHIK